MVLAALQSSPVPLTPDGSGGAAPAGHLPDLVIVGVQKGATSSIFTMLEDAGLACGTHYKNNPKEAHFFDFYEPGWERYGATDLAKRNYYQSLYTSRGCDHYLDATPSYLADWSVPARMVAVMPSTWMKSVRMLAILREPIARDLSEYNMLKEHWWKNGRGDESTFGGLALTKGKGAVLCPIDPKKHVDSKGNKIFQSYAEAVACKVTHWKANCSGEGDAMLERYHKHGCSHRDMPRGSKADFSGEELGNRLAIGMYYPQVHNFLKVISRKQLMLINFDSMLVQQKKHITAIVRHFGLRNGEHHKITEIPHTNSESFAGKVTTIDCTTARTLGKLYRPFNERLYYLINSTDTPPEHELPFEEFSVIPCGPKERMASEEEPREDDEPRGTR